MSTTINGVFPRLGEFRELKFANARKEISADELLARNCVQTLNIVKEQGI